MSDKKTWKVCIYPNKEKHVAYLELRSNDDDLVSIVLDDDGLDTLINQLIGIQNEVFVMDGAA